MLSLGIGPSYSPPHAGGQGGWCRGSRHRRDALDGHPCIVVTSTIRSSASRDRQLRSQSVAHAVRGKVGAVGIAESAIPTLPCASLRAPWRVTMKLPRRASAAWSWSKERHAEKGDLRPRPALPTSVASPLRCRAPLSELPISARRSSKSTRTSTNIGIEAVVRAPADGYSASREAAEAATVERSISALSSGQLVVQERRGYRFAARKRRNCDPRHVPTFYSRLGFACWIAPPPQHADERSREPRC
jgi:hypothetical protein